MSPAQARRPVVGQSWRYAKLNGFSGKLLDNQLDQIVKVGSTVDIDSQSEPPSKSAKKAWGTAWLSKDAGHDKGPEPLPGEIQQPWGSVLVDPHWGQVQAGAHPKRGRVHPIRDAALERAPV